MEDDFGCEWLLFNGVEAPPHDAPGLQFDSYLHEDGRINFVLYRWQGGFIAKNLQNEKFFKAVRQEPKEEGHGEF